MGTGHEFKDSNFPDPWLDVLGTEDEADRGQEDVGDMLTRHDALVARLRKIGDAIRSLHARLTIWHGRDPYKAAEWKWVIDSFLRQASTVDRQDFEELIRATIELHHRGTDILNPDRGPTPIPSPFVRRMPENQAQIERERLQHLGRHVVSYPEHIRYCMEHFGMAWTALIDGCLICDWDMIEDEFPKLEQLMVEVERAFKIWESMS